MFSHLLADQYIQIALNAFIGFILFSVITESIIRLFSIRNARLRACLRLIPPLRLTLEPLIWLLPTKTTIVNISLFSCSHPIQHFLYAMLSDSAQQELSQNGLKTVTGSLLLLVPTLLINIAITGAIAFSLFKIVTLTMQYATSIYNLNRIRYRGKKNVLMIHNIKLQRQLQKRGTDVVISPEIQIPIAGWKNCIIIPEELFNELSQKEIETVISHELEHLRWYDSIVKLIYHMIAAVYWWVPMRKWLNKIEQDHEMASDSSVRNYDLNGLDLATALKKTVQKQQFYYYKCAAFAKRSTTAGGKELLDRVKAVLNPSEQLKQNKVSAILSVLILFGLSLILGFVIC